MRIVVTGRNGQEAQSLQEKAFGYRVLELIVLGRPGLDLTRPETVHAAIGASRPDIVISAAAYTSVDGAEDEPDIAFAATALAPTAFAAKAMSGSSSAPSTDV